MIGSRVQVLLQSRFHLCRILPVLTSTESSFSILEPRCPREALICCREFKKCTRRLVSDSPRIRVTTPFFLRERTRSRVDKRFACTVLALESHILLSSARTSAVESRCARRFGTCRRSRRLLRVSESFEVGSHCRAVAESTFGLEFAH